MAITFVDGSANTGTGTSVTPTEPSGAAQNDLIIMATCVNTIDGVWTDPADFTEIDQNTATLGAPDTRNYIGYKIRGADAGSGYAMSYSGTSGNYASLISCYRGVDTSQPIDTTYVNATHFTSASNNMNLAAKAIDTTTANAWVVLYYFSTNPALTGVGAPSGFTQRDAGTGTVNAYTCDFADGAASTVTPGVFTHTGSDGQDPRIFTISLREIQAATSKLAVLKRNRHF